MAQLDRDQQLLALDHQLKYWRDNLAGRVASEAQALELELHKARDHELGEAQGLLKVAHGHVIQGCDLLRDLRRRLQDRA